jgi:hypothetical protein
MRQKLWVVRVIREGYVLATNEKEALAAQRDIEKWEDPPPTVGGKAAPVASTDVGR